MSGPFGSSQFMYATGAAEEGQSLRFEDGDSAYLSRTPTTAGNRKKFTISAWVKRANLSSGQDIIMQCGTESGGNQRAWFYFTGSDTLTFMFGNSASNTVGYEYYTNAVFRDPSAWYHVVAVIDTDNTNEYNSTAGTNRIEIYVNGEFQTLVRYRSAVPSGYANGRINSTIEHYIGRGYYAGYSDFYLANYTFLDGQALDPTSFGEYDDTLWKPKSDADIQSLTFGTNGFYLPFKQTTEAEGFSTVTYTGNSGTQSIEGVGFEPDFVWVKKRNGAENHELVDSVRGATKRLQSNVTAAENTGGFTSFDSSGFTLSGGYGTDNENGYNYVAWCWDAGSGSAASNTDGSITSSVKSNTAKGFSIVSYTGTGANATVGHGLSSAPEMIILKNRTSALGWPVYHSANGATKFMQLEITNAVQTASTVWQDTAPTSSVFSVGTSTYVNQSSSNFIAYCFHSVSGYSSIGSYSGTGATGNSVTLGFEPAFVMIKRSDASGDDWVMVDTTRSPVNPRDDHLTANSSAAETSGGNRGFDTSATGFTINHTGGAYNTSGGTYIYMAFADTRDATFFGDTSGNGNNWTPNSLNNTDVVPDSPVTGGNFASWNPISQQTSSTTFSEGNLKALIPASTANGKAMPTMGVNSGKWYWEYYYSVSNGNYLYVGITDPSAYTNNSYWIRGSDGETFKYENGTNSTGSGTTHRHTQGDIIQVAFDADNGKWYVGTNGTWSLSGDPVAGTGYVHNNIVSGEYGAFAANATSSSTQTVILNTGADSSFAGNATPQGNTDDNGVGDFYYAPPSGFLALTTGNLPAATITAPDEYFTAYLNTGNGTARSDVISFAPDLVWTKSRSASGFNIVQDTVRGAGNRLITDGTYAEAYSATYGSFQTDGFDFGSDANVNSSGVSYVDWFWKAGGTGVSNTDGSVTSTVSANPTAGFSVVGWASQSGTYTVGHGLSSAPELIIVKSRTTAGSNWWTFTTVIDGSLDYLALNTTGAKANDTFSTASPTATTFGIGSDYVYTSGDNIAYCFHSVEGYSKIGSYTGNGSSDGTFVHCGFRPAFVMLKVSSTTENWVIFDNERSEYNLSQLGLYPNTSGAEVTISTNGIDMLSNGFKLKGTGSRTNGSGNTYIFLAFAEAPFKSANAR